MTDTRTLFTSEEHQNRTAEQGLPLAHECIMRQELKTYVAIEGGFKVVTRTRNFRGTTHEDSFTEEMILNRSGL